MRCGMLVALLVTCSTAACDGDGVRTDFTGPSPIASAPLALARSLSLQPAVIVPQVVPTPFCPAQPPFVAPFNLFVRGDDRSALVLSQVQMQFVDAHGVRGASTTIPRPQLVSRFGSTTIPPFGTRSFPFSLAFGCVGGPTGTLTIVVVAVDSTGRERTASLKAPVG